MAILMTATLVADPEVGLLARGGELRGHKGGEAWVGGRAHSQKIFEF